jgi:putative RecB family exonuclease
MNNELDHLSYSSINTFLSCPANWKFHYLDKIPVQTSKDLIFGSAFHGAIESFLANKSKPDQPSLTDLWQDNWHKQIIVEDKPREDINWKDETPESLCNLGIRMFESPAIRDGILSITPTFNLDGNAAIEKKVELRVPGVPIPIIGYIDIMTPSGPGDFKTSGKSWSADKAENEMQPLFYLAALNQLGMTVPNWEFTHFVFVKTKTPQFQKITHQHNPSQCIWLFGMIRKVWLAIQSGAFPENPTGWMCSSDWCDYYSNCRGKYE